MYHARFNGTHYAIGKKWGMLLSKNGKQLLDNIPFDITKEMKEFAQQCYPVCYSLFDVCTCQSYELLKLRH